MFSISELYLCIVYIYLCGLVYFLQFYLIHFVFIHFNGIIMNFNHSFSVDLAFFSQSIATTIIRKRISPKELVHRLKPLLILRISFCYTSSYLIFFLVCVLFFKPYSFSNLHSLCLHSICIHRILNQL